MPLSTLIQYAYNLQKSQVVGGPAWLDSKLFDIDAKSDEPDNAVPSALTRELQIEYDSRQVQLLLADRFHLRMHAEEREIPVYSLVVAKGGMKMRASDDHSSLESIGVHDLPNSDWSGMRGVDGGRVIGIKVGMDRLASFLGFYGIADLDRPVLNMTGLTGFYDFQLAWTPAAGMTSDHPDPSRPGLFTAIEEQLGLKLESRKSPMKVLVIDHVEMPAEN